MLEVSKLNNDRKLRCDNPQFRGSRDTTFETNGASDADFAGDCVSHRSTIGGYGKKGKYGLI